MRKFSVLLPLVVAACATAASPADPAVVAKIKYVCAYSGLWQLGASLVLSPAPGAAAAIALIDAGVRDACDKPELTAAYVADGEALVNRLIDSFKRVGRM